MQFASSILSEGVHLHSYNAIYVAGKCEYCFDAKVCQIVVIRLVTRLDTFFKIVGTLRALCMTTNSRNRALFSISLQPREPLLGGRTALNLKSKSSSCCIQNPKYMAQNMAIIEPVPIALHVGGVGYIRMTRQQRYRHITPLYITFAHVQAFKFHA